MRKRFSAMSSTFIDLCNRLTIENVTNVLFMRLNLSNITDFNPALYSKLFLKSRQNSIGFKKEEKLLFGKKNNIIF